MKKYLKWAIILIIAIGIFGAINGDSSSSDEETKSESKTEKKEEKNVTYGIGQTIKVGDVEYTVNSINSSKKVGDEYFNHEAQEMYLIVNVSIKNNGDEALTVSDDFFKLKKGKKEYTTDTGGSIYLENNIIYEDVNPEATLTGNVLFDVTQETIDDSSLQLQVQTGSWGTEKGLINLH